MSRQPEQTKREQAAFELFLKASPSFAEQVESFHAARGDFPDIAVSLRAGNSIGFEMGEWLDKDQMGKSKRDESLRNSLLESVVRSRAVRPSNFEFVILDAKERVPFNKSDASAFGREFISLVADVERRWPREPSWHHPNGHFADDFSDYPMVQKYITLAHFFPLNPFPLITHALAEAAGDPEIQRLNDPNSAEAIQLWVEEFGEIGPRASTWVAVSDHGGAYSSESAIMALRERLEIKLTHYGQTTGELMLIVYYDQAVLYNTPYIDRINFDTFADVAREASQFVHGIRAGSFPFEKVFLLKALWPEPEAFEIWPSLNRCS